VVQGWVNYHAISDNQRKVSAFILETKRILFKWRNRKGGKRKLSWERFVHFLEEINYPANFKITSILQLTQYRRKPNSAIGSRMREIRTYGSEKGLTGETQWVYFPEEKVSKSGA